ncbi:DUF333 domain-containing protein [Vibrio sp. 10N.286.49.B3]|uniref:putative hemolysin n=1 Tax=Vibrio sp. 10N.286.49.B3 TaxID=1880855 RepID=UPI001F53C571|nr:DUF333 domain-containing protein [Vibrio sp. 10N.286.49.B3]
MGMTLTGCAQYEQDEEIKNYTKMSNPAAVYCAQKDGKLETVSENKRRVTYCNLPNEERVEQWEFYRNNHTDDGMEIKQ